jgi:hypothetical protein
MRVPPKMGKSTGGNLRLDAGKTKPQQHRSWVAA